MESSKKDLKEFREKVSQLQADLADREVNSIPKIQIHFRAEIQENSCKKHDGCVTA